MEWADSFDVESPRLRGAPCRGEQLQHRTAPVFATAFEIPAAKDEAAAYRIGGIVWDETQRYRISRILASGSGIFLACHPDGPRFLRAGGTCACRAVSKLPAKCTGPSPPKAAAQDDNPISQKTNSTSFAGPCLRARVPPTRIPPTLSKEASMSAAPVVPASPAPAPAPPMSEGARIINTFIAPSKTFTDLRRSAMWWAPWILISIFSVAFIFTIGKQVGFEQVNKNQIERSARQSEQFDRLPPDQQAARLQVSAKFFKYLFGFGSPFIILLATLISTTALWATFKVGAAAETTFGQAYAISMYAGLPGIIGAILGIVSLFAGVSPEGFDISNPVATNLAYFLDPETTGKFVRGMASCLDVLTIWSIILIGIGYACTSKVKRSTAIMIVAGWYLGYKLIASALATLG